jgi:hypothetical protein
MMVKKRRRKQKPPARRRQVMFSARPDSHDACLVLDYLERQPRRQRSEALWSLAAAAIRGECAGPDKPEEAVTDDLEALLDNL